MCLKSRLSFATGTFGSLRHYGALETTSLDPRTRRHDLGQPNDNGGSHLLAATLNDFVLTWRRMPQHHLIDLVVVLRLAAGIAREQRLQFSAIFKYARSRGQTGLNCFEERLGARAMVGQTNCSSFKKRLAWGRASDGGDSAFHSTLCSNVYLGRGRGILITKKIAAWRVGVWVRVCVGGSPAPWALSS